MLRRRLRTGRRLLLIICLTSSVSAFLASNQFALLRLALGFYDPLAIAQYRLAVLPEGAFVEEIRRAVENGEILEAQELVGLAGEYGHTLPAELVEQTQETALGYSLRNAREFLDGALYGHTNSMVSITGAMASDYIGFGDLRDVVVESGLMAQGKDYDQLTLGLAVFGLATIAPGSGPVDMAASMFKNAKKAGKISRPFLFKVAGIASRLVDGEALNTALKEIPQTAFRRPSITSTAASIRHADWSMIAKGDFSSVGDIFRLAFPVDMAAAGKSLGKAVRPEEAERMRTFLGSTGTVLSHGGVSAGLRAIEHTDDVSELSRFSRLAKGFGQKTAVTIRLLGKEAILLGKLAYALAGLLISSLFWMAGAIWLAGDLFRGFSRKL